MLFIESFSINKGLIVNEFSELFLPSNCSLRNRSSLKSKDPKGIDWAIELIEIKNRARIFILDLIKWQRDQIAGTSLEPSLPL